MGLVCEEFAKNDQERLSTLHISATLQEPPKCGDLITWEESFEKGGLNYVTVPWSSVTSDTQKGAVDTIKRDSRLRHCEVIRLV